MDQSVIASSTAAFIDAIKEFTSDNLVTVLVFTAGIVLWGVLKKWIFGGSRRI